MALWSLRSIMMAFGMRPTLALCLFGILMHTDIAETVQGSDTYFLRYRYSRQYAQLSRRADSHSLEPTRSSVFRIFIDPFPP
ncbi:hypothetical protein EJ02DRAFT_97419 [Clathrospora elynae]|uniref:Secreted protein n=1 Tax=Clathrospora elynae TaxID=706981 RepID=A0A6A5S8R9_9PLEO|nr:hypothetical protein EJ02DRAFT_97419 [Clathrospora elynae]